MTYKGNKKAFTLAEIMIVLLILAIIFAVMAPVFTKKLTKNTTNVWNWVRPLTNLNAYYMQGQDKPGQAFFGITPGTTATQDFEPYSKVIIRSDNLGNTIQKQIHFRYGYLPFYSNPSQERKDMMMQIGEDSGSWLMDTKNILVGGTYPDLLPIGNNEPGYSSSNSDYPYNNIAIGTKALNSINNKTGNNVNNNIAIGYNAGLATENSTNNIYIGSNAGNSSGNSKGQIFIGGLAGENNGGNNNIAIGYSAGLNSKNYPDNIYIGTLAGKGSEGANKLRNIGIGLDALTEQNSGYNSIAIGEHSLQNARTANSSIALGRNACKDYNGAISSKICIGANSGPKSGTKDLSYMSNSRESIYFGSKKSNHYGGAAVLEIHASSSMSEFGGGGQESYSLNNLPDIVGTSSTTVVNGNLVVRGRTFFTMGDFLYNFRKTPHGYEGGTTHTGAGGKIVEDNIMCSKNPLSYTFGNVTGSIANCPRIYLETTSDRRLKNIGSKSNAGLAQISKLKVFDYIFKADDKKTPQVGVIAQDLMKIFPNSVMQNKDGFLSIKLDEMFFAAINALKELDKKLVTLTKRLVNVESTITKLENENSDLKAEVANLTARINKIKTSRGL